jgi:uncharacterized membrane protein
MKQGRGVGAWIVIGLFLTSGVLHLVNPEAFLWLMPPFLPEPIVLIYASGVAELIAGVGLLLKARFAPLLTVLVLLAVWPANWWFAIDLIGEGEGWLVALAWLRLPLQIPLMWWAWRSPKRDEASRTEE